MKFSQMPYVRPNAEQVKNELQALTAALKNAADFAAAETAFLKKQELEKHVSTLRNLASIRHSIDTRDAFYDAEEQFFNSVMPEIQEFDQAFTAALLESPFRSDFEAKYGAVMFLNAQIELKTFSPAIISELQQENELVQAYEKLIASAQIPFEGKAYTIAQLAPFRQDTDDARRLAAWKAEGAWFKAHQGELDEIYDKLTRLRHTMAQKMGYGDYIELGYYRMGRNCYTKDDVETFRAAVVKYLVPVAAEVYKAAAERRGKAYPMTYNDNAILFASGEAKPTGAPGEILEAGRKFYHALSNETGEFFDTMLDNELLDVLSTEGKQSGGYCTELLDYSVPFIFANFNGTRDDVETATHEAGHAFAAWKNIDRVPISTIWPTMEGCEVHSMSMEFFAWPWAELFFGDRTRKFKYGHLAGALTFIPYGTMVDHFQHEIYAHPDWTPRERHACWKHLLGIYLPWQKLDGEIPVYGEGKGWQRQMHIYACPFYYIDYCLAQTVALQFWAKMQEDFDGAWNTYLAYTEQGGSDVFTALLKNAGLQSPFDESCLRSVCQKARDWLFGFDLSGIA